ncbi:MAG: 2-oxoacid:acceptor oxidoreductase family protein [Chloroflexi bacterium]|nr:2-oxoacid:acceptor oxidoreductase family protein [Chloroflexota bacterium]
MLEQVLIAGFGGQGVLFIGQLLAYAGLKEGLEVLWLPSYGPEMRGGTANCISIISTDKIWSPIVPRPKSLIAMNWPSLDKFEPKVVPDGVLVANSSLIERDIQRHDLRAYAVPASGVAQDLGNVRVSNMVALGAYVGATGVVSSEAVLSSLIKMLGDRKASLVDVNASAFRRGYEMTVGSRGQSNKVDIH